MKLFTTLLAILTLSGTSLQVPIEESAAIQQRDQQLEIRASGWCSSTKIITGYPGDNGAPTKIKYPALNGKVQDCILKQGAQGSAVKAVQNAVNICGAIPKAIQEDGKYGPKTEAAVRFVQNRWKVKVDGVWGPKTGAVMGWSAYQQDGSGRIYAYYCKKPKF